MNFVFQLLLLKVFNILGYLAKVIDKSNRNTFLKCISYFVIEVLFESILNTASVPRYTLCLNKNCTNYLCHNFVKFKPIWGHPFMTSTRRGVRRRWTHVDRGRGRSSPMWTSTQKI